jgi:hypothetical protein
VKTRKKTSIFWTTDVETLKKVLDESKSLSDVLRYFGKGTYGGNDRTLKARIISEGLDLDYYKTKWKDFQIETLKKNHLKNKIDIKDITVENSTYHRYNLKLRLIKEGLLKNVCSICGILPEWNNLPLSLQIDHINGVRDDNRLENLRLLCPNCHSQTHNFAGKSNKKEKLTKNESKGIKKYSRPSRRKTNRPETKEELESLISQHGYRGTGKLFGVSDNAVRKWLKYY